MIQFKLIETDIEKSIARNLVKNNHSYVPSYDSIGRRIDWLIYDNNKFIGMIGIGSSVYPPPKDLLNYLNMNKETYAKQFNSFANNWRFCLTQHIKNAGTQILKYIRNNAPIIWKQKYGDELKWLITFVGGGNNGAVYLADNWKNIGYTSGLPTHKAISMKWNNSDELKNNFVKPTGENRKIIFIHEVKRNENIKETEIFDL